jgi:hypothetical protein
MMYGPGVDHALLFGLGLPLIGAFAVIVLAWALFWQGLGLWHAARRGEWVWFVVFLLVHTLGILEIIYLFAIAKLKVNELFTKMVHHNN